MLKKKDFKKGSHVIICIGRLPMYQYRAQIVKVLDDTYCVIKVEPFRSGYHDNDLHRNGGYRIVSRFSTYLMLDDGHLDFSYDVDNPLVIYC